MIRQVFYIQTKSADLFTALQGTHRQVRLTATVALLDVDLFPQPLEPLMTLSQVQELQSSAAVAIDTGSKTPNGNNLYNQFQKLYARTC